MEELLYSWEFNSNKQRGKSWYIIALSIIVGLVIWGFLSNQYGMSFIILLIAGIVYFIENNSEDIIKVEINQLGLKVADSFYDFPKIRSYSILYSGENSIILRLFLNKKGIKTIDLYVNNDITKELETILPNFIKQNPKKDLEFFDKIIHFLKL